MLHDAVFAPGQSYPECEARRLASITSRGIVSSNRDVVTQQTGADCPRAFAQMNALHALRAY